MSLKTQLRKGLLAILVVIVIFIIMTSKSYLDLDGFVNHKLPINISLARQYEKVVGRWNLLSEQAQLLVKESDTDPNFNLWQTELENSLNFIEESVKEEKHKNIQNKKESKDNIEMQNNRVKSSQDSIKNTVDI